VESLDLPRLLSPSFSIVRKQGLVTLQKNLIDESKPIFLSDKVSSVKASSGDSKEVAKLIDGDLETEWSTERAEQRGNEWIEIKTKEAMVFDSIRLDTTQSPVDFPRGLSISIGKNCENEIFRAPTWEGEVLLSEDGFPYYGSQSEMVIRFGSSVTSNCLRIEQIAKDVPLHWSLTEVILFDKQV